MKTSMAMVIVMALVGMTDFVPAQRPNVGKRELLSEHETVAQFAGLEIHRCRGLTSLCPDRCGHSGQLAQFKILAYLSYKKPGEYGDEKGDSFALLIDNSLGAVKVPDAILKQILALKAGDPVLLTWRHDYITHNGGSEPERYITKLEAIAAEEAAKLTGKPLPPSPKTGDKPAATPRAVPMAR